jgi:hypothetical protein
LGWVFVYEHDLAGEQKDGKLGRNDIGLFKSNTQRHLPVTLRTYLKSGHLHTWYSEYTKNYRDALAHRISLYVPPSILGGTDLEKYREFEAQQQTLDLTKFENLKIYEEIMEQQRQLGQSSPFFAHSYSEDGWPVFLHAQIIADYKTVEEIINMFCKHFEPKAP